MFVNQGWFARCDVCQEPDDGSIAQRRLRTVKARIKGLQWHQFRGYKSSKVYLVCHGCADTRKKARALLSEIGILE